MEWLNANLFKKDVCDRHYSGESSISSINVITPAYLNNKQDEVDLFLDATRLAYDVLTFTETWFSDDINVSRLLGCDRDFIYCTCRGMAVPPFVSLIIFRTLSGLN